MAQTIIHPTAEQFVSDFCNVTVAMGGIKVVQLNEAVEAAREFSKLQSNALRRLAEHVQLMRDAQREMNSHAPALAANVDAIIRGILTPIEPAQTVKGS